MYHVRLARRAERGLRRIRQGDPKGYERVAAAIRALAGDPRPSGAMKLKGFEPPAWRLRVGEYRIVYEVHEEDVLVIVINVAPRGEVYR
jgi:mRNA interferase RelE/StbE